MSLGACTVYMTPSTTRGVASNFSMHLAWKTHCNSSVLTLSGVICVELAVALTEVGARVGEPVLGLAIGLQQAVERHLGAERRGGQEHQWQQHLHGIVTVTPFSVTR